MSIHLIITTMPVKDLNYNKHMDVYQNSSMSTVLMISSARSQSVSSVLIATREAMGTAKLFIFIQATDRRHPS